MSEAEAQSVTLCPLDAIPDGGAKGLEVGEKPQSVGVILLRRGEAVRSYLNRCPHRALPLETFPDAFLDETGELLVCTNHGARFRVSDGLCVKGPCLNLSLVRLPLRVEDGAVLLAAPLHVLVELFG
jgi:nitrite reductase/ring-hydroxylating ferredoxin subunit